MYTENELALIAKRENNNKRNFLVVNRYQGKHIPVNPSNFFKMTEDMADIIRNEYSDEKLLLVGFAETATAIGASLAVILNTGYIQTTREKIENVDWLYFTESHSHATEQKLVQNDIEKALESVQRIIFIEDEITTGNTILKIVEIIEREYEGKVSFSVASILNGMDKKSYEGYVKRNIGIHYLVKTEHSQYSETAEKYSGNGKYFEKNITVPSNAVNEIFITGGLNARRYVTGNAYEKACKKMWHELESVRDEIIKGKSILVLGTEEFMYPAIYTAFQLEKNGYNVKCHATTRSPIIVSKETGYPLQKRFELVSFYDDDRTTYIYDIEKYDTVIIMTDSDNKSDKGTNSLINALQSCGNENIHLIRWNTINFNEGK